MLDFARPSLLLVLLGLSALTACAGDDGAATDADASTTAAASTSTTAASTSTTAASTSTTAASTSTTAETDTDADTDTDTDTDTGTTGPADTCGDGVVDPGEACDDGNQIDDDACSNKCVKASCYDKKKNDSETDVDCGGLCAPCGLGGACEADADCKSGECDAGACASQLDLPACADQAVDADQVHKQVIVPTCGPTCHLGNSASGSLNLKDAAALKDNTVAVPSVQSLFDRVVPGVPDESYLVYKILGQQGKAPGGGGAAMPIGATLSNAQRCLVINWVKGGAL